MRNLSAKIRELEAAKGEVDSGQEAYSKRVEELEALNASHTETIKAQEEELELLTEQVKEGEAVEGQLREATQDCTDLQTDLDNL